jgi:hypothetical protein
MRRTVTTCDEQIHYRAAEITHLGKRERVG